MSDIIKCENTDCGFRVCAGYEQLFCPYCTSPFKTMNRPTKKQVVINDKVTAITKECFEVFTKHAQDGLRVIDALSAITATKSLLLELHVKNNGSMPLNLEQIQ